MKFYDISVPLSDQTPEWPGQTKYRRTEQKSSAIVSELRLSSHYGTHIDAPKHFIFDARTIDQTPLSALIGKFKVLAVKSKQLILVQDIQKFPINKGDRILFKTINSNIVTGAKFDRAYVALSLEAAQYLAKKKVSLVGIDYFGIETKGSPGHLVHQTLLKNKIVIVEGLNLQKIKSGTYQGAILPLKIQNGDAAPCRAVLWRA